MKHALPAFAVLAMAATLLPLVPAGIPRTPAMSTTTKRRGGAGRDAEISAWNEAVEQRKAARRRSS